MPLILPTLIGKADNYTILHSQLIVIVMGICYNKRQAFG